MYRFFKLLEAFSYFTFTKDSKLHFYFSSIIENHAPQTSCAHWFHSTLFQGPFIYILQNKTWETPVPENVGLEYWLAFFPRYFKYIPSLSAMRFFGVLWRLPSILRTLVQWNLIYGHRTPAHGSWEYLHEVIWAQTSTQNIPSLISNWTLEEKKIIRCVWLLV